jgi:LysB family phage lysis regulatory protein
MLNKYKLLAQIVGALALLAVVVGIGYWIVSPRIDLQRQRADTAEQSLKSANAQIEVQARVLEGQQQLLGQITAIGERMDGIERTINQNQREQGRALEELKRNDQTIADYLSQPVPAGLGLLYARPETTDPAAYQAGSGVQADPVLPAGASGAGSE